MRVAVVGAGLAGLSCADALRRAGNTVRVFDKSRGAGGRMATRRVQTVAGEASFDHGAQYFTARDAGFRSQVAAWRESGVAAPWPAAGPDAWVGLPAMNAPAKELAAGLDIAWGVQVSGLTRAGSQWGVAAEGLEATGFDAAVIAVPAEQAAPLLGAWDAEAGDLARSTVSEPCWTVMAAFPGRLPLAEDILRAQGVIGWAARNSAKPGRSGPESWVIQAAAAWSRTHLDEAPETVLPLVLQAFGDAAGEALPVSLSARAHRWRYAKSGAVGAGCVWKPALCLGACGDWLLGPRVEAAWLSGRQLAAAMLG